MRVGGDGIGNQPTKVQPTELEFGIKKGNSCGLFIDKSGIPLGEDKNQMKSSVLNKLIGRIIGDGRPIG